MQELPCPLSLRRTIVLVTLSHFCGSNAACLATAPNLSRYKSFLDDISRLPGVWFALISLIFTMFPKLSVILIFCSRSST